MLMTTTDHSTAQYPHIVETPGVMGGEPRIDGHRIRVRDIAAMRDTQGHSPHEIVELDYPQLSLGEVYAALAYFEDHREQMDAYSEQERLFVEQFKRENPHLIAADLSRESRT
jgi:uncharacterized protein (DUF433 family)